MYLVFRDYALRGLKAACSGWCLAAAISVAAQPAALPTESAERVLFDSVQNATVGLSVRVIEGATSAATLGRQRTGTGVVIEPQGLILTIGYLVLEADSVEIITRDQKKIPGQVVAYDTVTGLGLVRPLFPLAGVQPVKLGVASDIGKGAGLLFVTGSPPRQAGAVRLMDSRAFTGYWEYHLDSALYTAPLVMDHSGAGLFNTQGELVGVGNLAMRDVMPDDSPSVLAGNLFVPVDVLRPVLDELLRTGAHPQSRRPWIGINAALIEGRIRIVRVTANSPAQAAGLRVGHWVVSVDQQPVTSLEAFYKQVWARGLTQGVIRINVREGATERTLELPIRDRSDTLIKPRGI